MDEIAEFGYAAHFKYKNGQSNERGLDNLYEIMREAIVTADPDADEFMENIKSILTTSEITIFTPKGDMRSFPQGATALDFAYAIHEDIGNQAISAKVNHRNMPLSYELKNGDQIEIITSQKQKPSFDWLNIVQTAKARSSIRKAINQEVDKKAAIGQKKLNNLLTELNLTVTPRIIEKVKIHYNIEQDKEERLVFAYLSEQELNLDILRKILRQSSPEKKILFWTIRSKENTTMETDKPTTKIKYNYTLADCCRPIPGDPVMGFKMHQNIIEIHHVSCPEAIRLSSQQGNKIVEVDWFSREQKAFLSDIRISGVDRMGLVNDITTLLSKELDVNMRSINAYTHDGIFDGSIELYVRSIEDLNDIMSKLKEIQGVDKVLRPM